MVILIDMNTDALNDPYPEFDQLTQLEGAEYLLEFVWSPLESAMYMNVCDQDGNQIASGIRLVCGVSLLRKFNDSRLPPGDFLVVNMAETDVDPSAATDFDAANGGNFPLVYVTSDETFA
jgi:hypothetical protein